MLGRQEYDDVNKRKGGGRNQERLFVVVGKRCFGEKDEEIKLNTHKGEERDVTLQRKKSITRYTKQAA